MVQGAVGGTLTRLASRADLSHFAGEVKWLFTSPACGRGRYPLLTFQNTGAGPFSGSLIALLHATCGM
jgi:hypothetical protein